MDRRSALRTLALGAVGLAGCLGVDEEPADPAPGGRPSPVERTDSPGEPEERTRDPTPVRFGVEFDRVVDAVDDLGMDPSGEEPIDDALDEAYETGTLVEFPPGDYTVTREAPTDPPRSPSRFGMVGLGESHRDVQFHFPNADGEGGFWFVYQRGGTDVVLANFSLQVTDDQTTMANVRLDCADGALIEDVEWLGFIPESKYSYGQVLTCNVDAEHGGTTEGVNTLRRVTMGKGGALLRPHPSVYSGDGGQTGVRVYPEHVGEIVAEDLHIEQLGANGFRSTVSPGVVTIRGGLFKNNHLSNVRVQDGHHPEKTTTVRDARIVLDHDNPERPTGGSEFTHACGLHVDSTVGGAGAVFENCEIVCESVDAPSHWGLVRCSDTGGSNPGGFTLRGCTIRNETPLQTVWIQTKDLWSVLTGREEARPAFWDLPGDLPEHREVTIEDTEITVTAPSQDRGAVIVMEEGRSGSRITDCTISAPNGDIDGMRVGDDISVVDSTVQVSGQAVVQAGLDGSGPAPEE